MRDKNSNAQRQQLQALHKQRGKYGNPLTLRLARYDLEGNNSLSIDRIADKLEAAILDVRRRRQEAQEAEAQRATEQRKKEGWS